MMKRIVKIAAALFLLILLSAACSKQICPAYSIDSEAEHAEEVVKS
jgi:ABC-type oligopeptide transport system substrate-binding subunit